MKIIVQKFIRADFISEDKRCRGIIETFKETFPFLNTAFTAISRIRIPPRGPREFLRQKKQEGANEIPLKTSRPSWRDEKLVEKLTRNTARMHYRVQESWQPRSPTDSRDVPYCSKNTTLRRVFGKTTIITNIPYPTFDIKPLLVPLSSPCEISTHNSILHRR